MAHDVNVDEVNTGRNETRHLYSPLVERICNYSMAGINEPNTVDLITHDPERDEYALIMIEDRPWVDSSLQLAQLKEKIANYAIFALGDGLAETYPETIGKSLRIQLDSASSLSPKAQEIVDIATERFGQRNVRFVVNLLD